MFSARSSRSGFKTIIGFTTMNRAVLCIARDNYISVLLCSCARP